MRSIDPLARACASLFEQIPIEPGWERVVRGAAERGTLVHVLRNASLVDYLALEHLTRRLGLPRVAFANGLGQALDPLSDRLRGLGRRPRPPADRLREVVRRGHSAVLFLKASPRELGGGAGTRESGPPSTRARSDGGSLLQTLMEMGRREDREIIVVPEVLLWTQRPERLGFSLVDTVFGPADFPGEARGALQMLLNFKNAALRAGEPLSLRASAESEPDTERAARRASYTVLRRIERERRAAVGPMHKPVDRVREEVLRGPRLQATIRELAGPQPGPQAELTAKAREMLRELQAEPDPQTIKGIELVADPLVEQLYAGVDVDQEGLERVREAARRGSVVLLPSHKSHVDYLLISYVFRKAALELPVIAAGDNLDFFPLGPLFRRSGAFFIRRQFKGDRLYMAVVSAYVRRLIRDGFAIEIFLEGGRSRTGKLLPPKLGLLNMVVEAALSLEHRQVSFVPINIGYERMMEEGAYARELSGEAKRPEDARALLKVGSVLREKYGRANVQFGEVLSLADLRAELGPAPGPFSPARRRALVNRLAHRAMSEINRVASVTPGSLVALALLGQRRRGTPHLELMAECARLTTLVQRLGARTAPSLTSSSGELRPRAIREAAIVYVRGGLVRQHVPGDTLTARSRSRARIYTGDDVIYTVDSDRRLALDIPKNLILHLFVDRALIATAALASPGTPLSLAEVRERVHSLSRLFKYEFVFRTGASFDAIFDETLRDMCDAGVFSLDDGVLELGPGSDGLGGRGWATFFAATVQNFIEGYLVAARSLRALVRGALSPRELTSRALRVGEQLFMSGEIERAEAVSQPIIGNALAAFVDQGYLRRADGKLELAESFASEQAVKTMEAKIASYLLRRPEELR